LSKEKQQPGADPQQLSALSNNFLASPQAGLANRTLGIFADVSTISNESKLPQPTPTTPLLKATQSPLAQRVGPNLGFLNTVAVPINAAQGLNNTAQGFNKLTQGDTLAKQGEGGAQLGQGGAQLTAAGTGAVNLAAKLTPGMEAAGSASGKLLLKTLGPAIAAFDGGRDGFKAVQAYQDGNNGEALEKGFSATMKVGGAGLMKFGGPVGAAVGGGMILGTSIADGLNQLECVQNAQDKVAGWFSGPQSLPAPSKAEMDKLIADHRAKKAQKLALQESAR